MTIHKIHTEAEYRDALKEVSALVDSDLVQFRVLNCFYVQMRAIPTSSPAITRK